MPIIAAATASFVSVSTAANKPSAHNHFESWHYIEVYENRGFLNKPLLGNFAGIESNAPIYTQGEEYNLLIDMREDAGSKFRDNLEEYLKNYYADKDMKVKISGRCTSDSFQYLGNKNTVIVTAEGLMNYENFNKWREGEKFKRLDGFDELKNLLKLDEKSLVLKHEDEILRTFKETYRIPSNVHVFIYDNSIVIDKIIQNVDGVKQHGLFELMKINNENPFDMETGLNSDHMNMFLGIKPEQSIDDRDFGLEN